MTYYLLLDGDSEQDTLYDTNVLGEESFGTFYVSMGFSLFEREFSLINLTKYSQIS